MIPIFPEETLAASVTTTVWVGVWVVVFFNLRLGWSLSGLVVPGYLVPLLIVKPMSASVIILEAIITFWIVRAFSERPTQPRYWCSFFGRDRFFALVLVSVLVRAVMDGWLLPWLGPRLVDWTGISLDYRNHLHSYGLVIVSLVANYFWKPGVVRGLWPLSVNIGLTFLITRFVLMEFTNFSLGGLQYMYEDIASSLLASPKAYIILVFTALLASWMNLRYAWDFNGILIPALLALQWYEPLKILASFAEAGVILVLATGLLRLPMFRKTTMEGGRKLLVFFNLAFLYRLILGFVIPEIFGHVKVTDMFGTGYLLTTLLAVKAHDKQVLIRITRASLQVSLVGSVAGTMLGFALSLLPTAWVLPSSDGQHAPREAPQEYDEPLPEVVRKDKLVLYRQREPDQYSPPLSGELDRFVQGMRHLDGYIARSDEQELELARKHLAAANYVVHRVQDRYLYCREQAPQHGWGFYIFDTQNPQGPVIEVPAPLDEWATLECGLALFRHLKGSCLAIAGSSRRATRDGAADVLINGRSMFGMFHREFGRGRVIQIRALTRGLKRAIQHKGFDPRRSGLWVSRRLPAGVHLPTLHGLVDDFEIHWAGTPQMNVLRDGSSGAIAEWVLTRQDRRKLFARLITAEEGTQNSEIKQLKQSVVSWFQERKDRLATRGSDAYRPAQLSELLYFDQEVLTPLLNIVLRSNRPVDSMIGELRTVAAAAGVLDYELALIEDPSSERFLALVERDADDMRHWGSYLFRLGNAEPIVVEVPRPILEKNVVEFGVNLFRDGRAQAIFLAGAHPYANRDASSDTVRAAYRVNLFNLMHQAMMRESHDLPLLMVQCRAIQSPVAADIIMATADGVRIWDDLDNQCLRLADHFRQRGLEIALVDGAEETAGYALASSVHASTVTFYENKRFVGLWLSPAYRRSFQLPGEEGLEQAAFDALAIPTSRLPLITFLRQSTSETEDATSITTTNSDRQLITQFVESRDTVVLAALRQSHSDFTFDRVIDETSGLSFLVIGQRGQDDALNRLPIVIKLSGGSWNHSLFTVERYDAPSVQSFVSGASGWMMAAPRRDP